MSNIYANVTEILDKICDRLTNRMARSPLASLLVLAAAAFIVGQLSTFVPSPQQVARTEMQQAGRVPEV